MKINILRAILIILLILQMWIIFGFSNQNGEESGSISRRITEAVTKNISSIQEEKEKVLRKIEHIIRKLAHFSLYTIIGILLMSLMSTYKIKQRKRILISGSIGLLYAISDEIHQSFIPGRGPQIGDVGIDFCGVMVGMCIVLVSISFYTNRRVKWLLSSYIKILAL